MNMKQFALKLSARALNWAFLVTCLWLLCSANLLNFWGDASGFGVQLRGIGGYYFENTNFQSFE
jgi:hypothetical protein